MTTTRPASSLRIALVILLFIGAGLGAQPQSGPRSPSATLFAPAAPGAAADRAPEARAAASSRPEPRRARTVTLNLGALRDLPPGQARLHLNLFDDTVLTAMAETLETRGPASFTWHGRLVDGRTGQATFVSTDGAVAGTIFTEDSVFEVNYVGDGVHEVIELDPMAFPTDDPPHDMTPPALDGLAADGVVAAADSAAQIDVMVVWTPAARNAAGGFSGIQSLVDLAVANTNTAYANSGITTRLRLVYKGEVDYVESNIDTDLSRLTSTADGHMDVVHTLRNQYGADIVTLLGAGYTSSSGACGVGWLMSSVGSWFASNAFNVVDRSCAGGNMTYAHEVGHNQGMHHDPPNAGGAAYPYAYGYVDPSCSFRTVLAYGGCQRVMHFSSPLMLRNGLVTGTSTQDNARTLNNTAMTVANFRQAVNASCSYTLSSVGTSIVAGGGSLAVGVTTTSGCAWSATSNANWITVTGGASGTASGTVSLAVAANTSTVARTGTVTIAGQTYTVTQAGQPCSYTLGSTSASVVAGGGSLAVGVTTTSGCAWTATSNANWISVTSGASGSASGTVSLAVAANTSTVARTGTVTIAGQTYTVTQAGQPCAYALGSTSSTAPSAGGSIYVSVTATTGCGWTATSSAGWISVTAGASGTSSGTVTLSVAANTNGSSRTGTATIAGLTFTVTQAGTSSKKLASQKWKADFEDAGNAAFATWEPSTGMWQVRRRSPLDGSAADTTRQWGSQAMGDVPVPGDYDGDGRTDFAVWRGPTGMWIILLSSSGYTQRLALQLGSTELGDVPVAGDYDGDGRTDVAVWRPSTGTWLVRTSSSGFASFLTWQWGASTDLPIVGDYDGDGRTDLAVWRPGTGTFIIRSSSSQYTDRTGVVLGSREHGDVPVSGDFDNDGRTDVAVWRPGTGVWYVLTSTTGYLSGFSLQWGSAANGDMPVVNDYDGDGASDIAVWRRSTQTWIVRSSSSGFVNSFRMVSGTATATPIR
jgi:hypothetical protein